MQAPGAERERERERQAARACVCARMSWCAHVSFEKGVLPANSDSSAVAVGRGDLCRRMSRWADE
eukprot:3886287-Pleurochrysis_carterae.AAC.1